MSISAPFIRRPIGTILLTAAIALAGGVAFYLLPVSPLPQVDFPTISVSASLPGASPETMAAAVATPLERQFGRIAGITEMSSSSSLGSTSVTLQFDLSRDIDGAARDVEAAINAARGNLPSNLPSNPSYKKVNPSDSPIMIIALTSDIYSKGQMYDTASTVLAQKVSQVDGVGQVTVGGSSLPAVRVDLNPLMLNQYGIGLEQVRTALGGSDSNLPKGHFADNRRTWTLQANDQLYNAVQYRPLIIAYRNGAPVRVSDVADVTDSVADVRNAGYSDGKPSVLLVISREPQANIISTVDRINALLPTLRAEVPSGVKLDVMMDRTTTIRASISDVERTLIIAIGLVILVVFIFLRDVRTMFIPGIAVPVSLIGTFGVMYLLGYSLDNLSLMALTISTGFVVDDAIVVVENITRYIEKGMRPVEAARRGAAEIGFTILSISISLIAVFTPILLMSGVVGRLFREFAVTLSVAIAISMVISLTTTPMMCALLLKPESERNRGRLYHASERVFNAALHFYERTLTRVLLHPAITLLVLLCLLVLNAYLFYIVPKGFFPQQDTGRLQGSLVADQDTSFQATNTRLQQMIKIVRADPAVLSVVGFTGGTNSARVFISLKPLSQRKSADLVIAGLRPKLARIPGATLYLQSAQDLRVGGMSTNALYQYTLQSDNFSDVSTWAPKLLAALKKIPILTDVNSSQQNQGMQAMLTYDRDTAARFGISSQLLDNTLYDAFGQRPVAVIYRSLNQYQVIMETAPQYWQNPDGLRDIYVLSSSGAEVPLSAVASYSTTLAPLSISHLGQFAAVTLSFNLVPGKALGDAVNAVNQAERQIGLPETVRGNFAGTAEVYQSTLSNEVWIVLAALTAVYIVLGILYESYIHPITILSTLPSAALGAALALLITNTPLDLIAMIGIILLIGIVKKNAIMMIDFALAAERHEGKSPRDAIFEACQLRFRPILMTTMAAIFGAIPLALDFATGSELRRPLGFTIIGGLIVSQLLTLYTTPVIYLMWENLAQLWWHEGPALRAPAQQPGPPPAVARPGSRSMKNHHPRIPGLLPTAGPKDQPPENSRLRKMPFASRRPFPLSPFSFLLPFLLAACSVGPDYTGPPSPPGPVPTSYKESDAWKPANPRDDMIKGKWWEMYHDPQLNALEEQVDINNQNVLQAEAQFVEAAAAVKVARAAFFPTVTTSPNYTLTHPETGGRGNGSGGSSTSSGSGGTGTGTGGGGSRGSVALSGAASLYDVPVNVSYIVDIWGAVRRNVEAQSATAQASFATLENARLSFQATLAEDYFQLLGLDAEKELLEKTLVSYQQFITLTKNRYNSGIASKGDVAQAQAQYDATNVQLVDLGVARAQFEDAIAVLIGKPAPSFSVQYKPLHALPPKIPAGVPTELLERRPDIAEAERQVAAANATIGVNVAAYYPQLTLTGSAATEAIELSELFSGPTFLWSVGPTLAQTLFDAGKIHGQVQEARAAYDADVANYRQTVLTGFQQVEDNLSGLRILQEETGAEEDAVKSAQQSLDVTVNQYQSGIVDYLNVITTQAVLLNDQVNAVNLRTREMTTSVLLIEALGGGWDTSQLPGRPGVSDVPPAQADITKSRQ